VAGVDARTVSVILFDGFELLDVFGPVEMLHLVPGVAIDYAGPAAGPVTSSQGCRVVAGCGYEDLVEPDIVLVPGGIRYPPRPESLDEDPPAQGRPVVLQSLARPPLEADVSAEIRFHGEPFLMIPMIDHWSSTSLGGMHDIY